MEQDNQQQTPEEKGQPAKTISSSLKPTSKKTKKNFSLIIMLSFSTIVASLIALFFYFQNNQLRNELAKKLEALITPSPLPTQIEEEDKDWQIYTGEDNKFTFKYPENANLIADECISLQIIGPTQTEATEAFDGLYLNFCPKTLENQTLDEWIAIDMSKEDIEIIKPKTKYSLKDYTAFEYITSGLLKQTSIAIQSPFSNSEIVVIRDVTQDPTNQGYEKTVKKIISTFEFNKN